MPDDRKPPRMTILGERNEGRKVKVPTSPTGVPTGEFDRDDLTPPPVNVPDEIEIKAVRVDERAKAIRKRPGPTPTDGSLQTALTIDGVRHEIDQHLAPVKADVAEVKKDVKQLTGTLLPALINELSADRAQRRDEDHAVFQQHIAINTKRETTKIEDDADRKKQKRERWTNVVKGVFGGTAILEILHRLFG